MGIAKFKFKTKEFSKDKNARKIENDGNSTF